MNQILISEKVYVTKEMKRKRKTYKFIYTISVITLIVLILYYIIAEKDRNDREGLSKEIMKQIQEIDDDETTVVEKSIVVALDDRDEDPQVVPIENIEPQEEPNEQAQTSEVTASDGKKYTTEATFEYERLGINYPVLSEENEELLKVSLCKYWGPEPNNVGNYCIVGHNYKSGKMFGKLAMANIGDRVKLTAINGGTVTYEIYNKYVVDPKDVSCTSQMTNGAKELTLITCTDYGKRRLVLKAREV